MPRITITEPGKDSQAYRFDIKLDGERMEQITLTNGMEVEIGDVSAIFSLTEEECDQLTEERFRHKDPKEKEVNTLAETD